VLQTRSSIVAKLKPANPCVKFHNQERGYVRCMVTPGKWVSDDVVVEDVKAVGRNVLTRASYTVEAGRTGAHLS
jgi:alkaline phosphatase D